MPYEIRKLGESRSFPPGNSFLDGAEAGADVLILVGETYVPDPSKTAILVELGTECLGFHTGAAAGAEGSNAVGFARYRNGDDEPSNLVELVRQPATDEVAIAAARAVFEAAGLTVHCDDCPSSRRITVVDQLINLFFRPIRRSVSS